MTAAQAARAARLEHYAARLEDWQRLDAVPVVTAARAARSLDAAPVVTAAPAVVTP